MPSLPEVLKEKAERRLFNFIQQAWHVLEPPTRQFQTNWHLGQMCELLEAVTMGQFQNLLMNVPPGAMKSLTTTVFWPAWVWTQKPEWRWLFASYQAALSIRDSVRCRRVILSPWYQENWGDRFSLTDDQNAKLRFENTKTGFRIATSEDGLGTGERGDAVVVDDPHNVKKAQSDKEREGTIEWWDETMTNRLNDPAKSARVVIMQRLHERDLSGHLIEQGGYVHYMVPMRFEPDRRCVVDLGAKVIQDPREHDGELYWKQRFTEPVVDDLEARMGSYAVAGQHQQRPAPRKGGMFEREWFEIVREAPAPNPNQPDVRYWDLAATEESKTSADPDWLAGLLMREMGGIYYILDVRRARVSPAKGERLIQQTAYQDGEGTTIWLEQEPGSSGKALISHYQRNVLKGFTVRGNPESGSKTLRADPLSAAAEAGNVKLVKGPWNQAFLDEIGTFPRGAHDDQVDAASGAFRKVTRGQAYFSIT